MAMSILRSQNFRYQTARYQTAIYLQENGDFLAYTVPTERNLTPERTQSEPGVRPLGSLCVRY
jgi:hypothetical protein